MKISAKLLFTLGLQILLIPMCRADQAETYTVSNAAGTCEFTMTTFFEPDEDFKWHSDACENGKAAGNGWMEWSKDVRWEGTFENGLRKYGRFSHPGGWCEGNYKESLEGQAKCFDANNGATFEGNYHMGMRSGIVVQTYRGTYFKGMWAQDQKNGYGEMRWANGDLYEGNHKNGLYDGKGKYTHATGEVYEGEYKEDDRNGKGRMTYPHGDWYEGEFRNDQKNGQGVYYWADTDTRFVGLFRDGQPVRSQGKYMKGSGK